MTGAMAFPVRAAGESPAQMQPMSIAMEVPKGWASIIEESERRLAEIERLRVALKFIASCEGPLLQSTACMMRDKARSALSNEQLLDKK